MKILILKGDDIQKDKNTLYDNIEDPEVVFILDNPSKKLHEYIDEFNLKDNEELYTIKFCKEISNLDVDYCGKHYTKFSKLLDDINTETESMLVVKGDLVEEREAAVRTQLSAIVQQLVYLGIPLGNLHIVTEKESKDLKKIQRYEQNVALYAELVQKACLEIASKNFPNNQQLQTKVVESLQKIQGYIADSRQTELKVAAVGSKKSGKSAVVDSILGCELAPTSLELATPNTCIYKKSDRFYLIYNGETNFFETAKELKDCVLKHFKGAQFNKEQAYAIPNMEIGYIPSKSQIASFTVYDTPGPDLAGAEGHAAAAKKAVEETDVAIFSIDYTKYATNDEMEWLEMVKEIFSQKKKFHSLIFDINKTDMMFMNEGDKCRVRAIDFIREKLIDINPAFKDSIIFGTSARTYYDAVESSNIPGFEDFETSSFDHLEDEIGKRMARNKLGGEHKTRLKFLKDQIGNASTFLNQNLSNLQQVKQFSGMLDLLNYVNYITQNKARAERLNNLIYNIDTEVANIWNKFTFAEVENKLAENMEKIEKAKEILDNFSKEINVIYDEKYPDIKIKAESKKLKSTTLKKGFEEKDAKLNNLAGFVREIFIDHQISGTKCSESVLDEQFKALYRSNLKTAFSNSTEYRCGKKALHEDAICSILYSLVMSRLSDVGITNIQNQITNCTEELKKETKKIQCDLIEIVNERQVKMKGAIEKCKYELKSNYNIDFDLQTPTIDFAFKYQGEATPKSLDIKNLNYQKLWDELKQSFSTTTLSKGNDRLGIKNFISKIGITTINEICISLDKNIEVYEKQIKPLLKDSIADSLKSEIKNVKDTLTKMVENVVKDVVEQMEIARDFGVQQSHNASNTIVNTRALAEDNDRLNEQKRTLEEIKNCVEEFHIKWLETVTEEA